MPSCRGRNKSPERTKSPHRLRCDLISMAKTGSHCSPRGENCDSFHVRGGEAESRGREMRDGVKGDFPEWGHLHYNSRKKEREEKEKCTTPQKTSSLGRRGVVWSLGKFEHTLIESSLRDGRVSLYGFLA